MTELSKAEQELMEKTAKYLYQLAGGGDWDSEPERQRNYLELSKAPFLRQASQIHTIYKEAGYVQPNSKGMVFDGVVDTLKPEEMLHQWAKANGYVLLGQLELLVKKPVTGLPQIGNFPPEEYQPILGGIPPEPWELTGYSGDRYLTVEGRKNILEDVYLARKTKADWKALSPEDRARLEQEQKDRETEE